MADQHSSHSSGSDAQQGTSGGNTSGSKSGSGSNSGSPTSGNQSGMSGGTGGSKGTSGGSGNQGGMSGSSGSKTGGTGGQSGTGSSNGSKGGSNTDQRGGGAGGGDKYATDSDDKTNYNTSSNKGNSSSSSTSSSKPNGSGMHSNGSSEKQESGSDEGGSEDDSEDDPAGYRASMRYEGSKEMNDDSNYGSRGGGSAGRASGRWRSNSSDRNSINDRSRSAGQWSDSNSAQRRGQSGYGLYGSGSRGSYASPFSLMRRMAEDMDRILDDYGMGAGAAHHSGNALSAGDSWQHQSTPSQQSTSLSSEATWNPEVEVFHRGDKVVVRADLPGLKKEDVHVDVEDDILTISGERSHEEKNDRKDYYQSERSYGKFWRAIALPDGVDADDCDAKFKDGVLEVEFKAPEPEQRRKKSISIH
jgi:HSP20 family protein